MYMKVSFATVCCLLASVLTTNASAAKKPAPVNLTATGEQLAKKYAELLAEAKADVKKALPKIDEQKKSAYLKSLEVEKAAVAAVNDAQKQLGKVGTAHALVNHAKGKWIGGADRGIAKAKEMLKKATTDAERNAAQQELAQWQENRAAGMQALNERQAALEKALLQEPQWKKNLEAAKESLAQAKARMQQALSALNLKPYLSSDKLDAKLAKFVVLQEATPRGLAAYAQQGKVQQQLVDELLANPDLMEQMVLADGAKDGNYGQAMEIYTAIQKKSKKAADGVLQQLALAISLEHAVPISQNNPERAAAAPATVDPVPRYLHYEMAYESGELDPGFAGLTAWDLRYVVNGNEPDWMLAWGREMLRNYRPDHITTPDYAWRYVAIVRTDVRYGSQDNKFDRGDLQFFQNILMNGGVCGRRAFIGRFILRAFGIPTVARPQRGHAALAHWTPDGWVVCLGGGWGAGWAPGRYTSDLNFLATTQARATGEPFMQVKRALWIGDVMGEDRCRGLVGGDPAFWNSVGLYTQRAIIESANSQTLAAVGEELGEANESKVKYAFESPAVTEKDRKISVSQNGVISIPAAACSNPTKSTGKIIFMPSVLGGKQLHYSRTGGPQSFEYTFEAPAAGTYELTARVVTPSWQQHLLVSANDAKPVTIDLPHTVGMWDETQPVKVSLVKGKNVLRFSHKASGQPKGVTIKDFTLTPVK